jgi:hypothetical protein
LSRARSGATLPVGRALAVDLSNPDQIKVTARGNQTEGTSFRVHFKRWIKAAGMSYEPSPLPTEQIDQVPIVMVAVPNRDVTDATLYSLRVAVNRSLGTRPGARLACVTVISPSETSASDASKSESRVHTRYLEMLKQWAQGIEMGVPPNVISRHRVERFRPKHCWPTRARKPCERNGAGCRDARP